MAMDPKICRNRTGLETIRNLYVDEDGLSRADLDALAGAEPGFDALDAQALNEGRNQSGCAGLDSFIVERFRWFKSHPAAQSGSHYLKFRDSYIANRLGHEDKISDLISIAHEHITYALTPEVLGIMIGKVFDRALKTPASLGEFFAAVDRHDYRPPCVLAPEFVNKVRQLLRDTILSETSDSFLVFALRLLKKILPRDVYIDFVRELLGRLKPALAGGFKEKTERDKLYADPLEVLSDYLDEERLRKVSIPLLESERKEDRLTAYHILTRKGISKDDRETKRFFFMLAHLGTSPRPNPDYYPQDFLLQRLRHGDQREQALAIVAYLDPERYALDDSWLPDAALLNEEIKSRIPLFRENLENSRDEFIRLAAMMALLEFGTDEDARKMMARLESGNPGIGEQLSTLNAIAGCGFPLQLNADLVTQIKKLRFHGRLKLASPLILDGGRLRFDEGTSLVFVNGKIWSAQATGKEENLSITVGSRRYRSATFWYNDRLRTGHSNRGAVEGKSSFVRYSSDGVLLESRLGSWVRYYFRDGTPMTGSVEEWRKRFGNIDFRDLRWNGGFYDESDPKILMPLMSVLQDFPDAVRKAITVIDTRNYASRFAVDATYVLFPGEYGGHIVVGPGPLIPTAFAHELVHALHFAMGSHWYDNTGQKEYDFSNSWRARGSCYEDKESVSRIVQSRHFSPGMVITTSSSDINFQSGCVSDYARDPRHNKAGFLTKSNPISEDMAEFGRMAYETTVSDASNASTLLQTTSDPRYRRKLDLLYQYGFLTEEAYRQVLFE